MSYTAFDVHDSLSKWRANMCADLGLVKLCADGMLLDNGKAQSRYAGVTVAFLEL